MPGAVLLIAVHHLVPRAFPLALGKGPGNEVVQYRLLAANDLKTLNNERHVAKELFPTSTKPTNESLDFIPGRTN